MTDPSKLVRYVRKRGPSVGPILVEALCNALEEKGRELRRIERKNYVYRVMDERLRQKERERTEYLGYLRNIYARICGEDAWTPSAQSIYNDTLNALEEREREVERLRWFYDNMRDTDRRNLQMEYELAREREGNE